MKNLFFVFAFLAFLSTGVTLVASSNPINTPILIEEANEEAFVFVHISLRLEIQERSPKGVVAKVTGIREGKVDSPKKNIFTGSMQLKDGKLQIQLDKKPKRQVKIIMPEGFQISPELSKKLGASQQVVMSGGSTMLKPHVDSMLWFEIQ